MTPDNILHLLNAPEALDSYLVDVRRRLEANRGLRRRAYWLDAVERLGEELEAARAEKDEQILAELEEVLASFRSALAALPAPASDPSPSQAERTVETSLTPVAEQDTVSERSLVHRNGTHSANGFHAAEPLPVRAAPPPADEAARAALTAQCQALRLRIREYLAAEDRSLAHALRSRSLFCEGQALALNPDTPDVGGQALTDPLDDLAASPSPWAGGHPFDFRERESLVWGSLAELYETGAAAGEALDWLSAHEEELPEQLRVDALNAISAAQQRLYRGHGGIGRRDDAVHEMYRWIRSVGENTGFIRALSSSVSEAELVEIAAGGGRLFERMHAELEERRARAERDARKEAAVAAVVAWEASLEGRGVTSESLETDRQGLCALLDECLAAGVPTSTVKVRAAVMDTAPVLLEGQFKYAKFLEAVALEREKRSLAAVEVAPPEVEVRDEELGRLVEVVAPFIRGRKIVMLGGKSRPQVAQELGGLLECGVIWLDSDRGDKFNKFASAIKKADVVLMLKNFASHEIFYGSKDAMSASSKHFVVIPSGYSVKQVVYQISEYVARERVTVATASPIRAVCA